MTQLVPARTGLVAGLNVHEITGASGANCIRIIQEARQAPSGPALSNSQLRAALRRLGPR